MKKTLIILIILCLAGIFMLYRPAGKITYNKTVSENRIVIRYEIYGCGNFIPKVLDGGDKITAKYKEDYPEIGTDEVHLTGNKKPRDVFDYFPIGGSIDQYDFVIEGKSVGVTKGATDCCSTEPAYNKNVVDFKIDKWYFTSYVPFVYVGDFGIIMIAGAMIFISFVGMIILMLIWITLKIKKNNT